MDCEDYMTDDELMDLADFFKNFADSTRLKILFLLQEGEFSVNEIASRLGMGQSAISSQLKTLKASRLVRPRKDGRMVYYRLCDEHIAKILETGKEHSLELYS